MHCKLLTCAVGIYGNPRPRNLLKCDIPMRKYNNFFFLKCTLLFPSKEKNILETISGLKAVNVFRSLKKCSSNLFQLYILL